MSGTKLSDTWAQQHHALAKRFLERKIADAIKLELSLAGQPGFLSIEEIQTVLLAGVMACAASQKVAE